MSDDDARATGEDIVLFRFALGSRQAPQSVEVSRSGDEVFLRAGDPVDSNLVRSLNSAMATVQRRTGPVGYDEVAKLLGVSKKWVQRRVQSGAMPHRRLGRLVRFYPEDLVEIERLYRRDRYGQMIYLDADSEDDGQ